MDPSGLISRFLGFVFLPVLCFPIYAQRERDTYTTGPTNEISGLVRIAETGALAKSVPVRLERFSGGLVDQIATDGFGKFRFPGLARGYYTVSIAAPGFNPIQQSADLQFNFRQYLLFELTRDSSDSPDRATDGIRIIDARVPEIAREEYAKARAEFLNKNFKAAVEHLQKTLVAYPDFFDAQLMLGTSYVDLREWANAEVALNEAVRLKPDSAVTLVALGEVYWRLKRYEDSEKALLDGLKLDENSWQGYFTLGRLYWDRDDVMKAAPAVGRTLQLKPDFAEAHLLAGNILLKLQQQERALAEYQEYLRLAPKGEFAAQTRELVQKLSKALVEKK